MGVIIRLGIATLTYTTADVGKRRFRLTLAGAQALHAGVTNRHSETDGPGVWDFRLATIYVNSLFFLFFFFSLHFRPLSAL